MINYMRDTIRKYTKILIRIDDVTENMNWENMDKCEKLFDENNIIPLLGVIPLNQDPEFLKYPKNIYILKNQIKKIYLNMGATQNFLD